MKEYFDFSKMITPSLITAFWIVFSVLFILSFGFELYNLQWNRLSASERRNYFFAYGMGFILGLVAIRVIAEIIIVLFKINENLTKIANGSTPTAPEPRKVAGNVTVTSFDDEGKPSAYKPKVFLSE